MANPTSNFGWQMPTNSDLVKDLPADFEVFGQAVDTSLADLKGGTTGQVLSKASNTDMDFTWVAQDDSNAIQNAIVDAKGDLISATAADTPARLAVGADGTYLQADSTTSTGLKWGTVSAGGMTLISTTSLNGVSTTISSIPTTYKNLEIVVRNFKPTGEGELYIQMNADTTANRHNYVLTAVANMNTGIAFNATEFPVMPYADNTVSYGLGNIEIKDYANTDTWKTARVYSMSTDYVDTDKFTQYQIYGFYKSTSAITSLKFFVGSGTATATILVYGVK